MPSVRLTNFDREDIRDRALKAAFETRNVDLAHREHALAKEAYEAVIPADERAKAALARLARAPEPFDVEEGRARFDAAFEGKWAA